MQRNLIDNIKLTILASGILLSSCLAASAQEVLSTERIQNEIIGREFSGRMGLLRASLIYNTDGTIAMRAPIGTGGGTWTLVQNGMCVDITSGPRQGEECLTFTDNGSGGYDVSNGMTLVRR